MRLFEFEGTKAINTQAMKNTLVTAIDQLKSDLDRGKIVPEKWNTEEDGKSGLDKLIDYFHMFGVILGKENLFSMIEKDPLQKVITNIQGQKIVFKGHEEEKASAKPEKDKETVSKMAHKAMKK